MRAQEPLPLLPTPSHGDGELAAATRLKQQVEHRGRQVQRLGEALAQRRL